jgi:hypothetical protein
MWTLTDSQEIEFGDKCIGITSPAGKFEYYYSNPEIVTAAPTNEIEHVDVYKFKVTA